MVAKTAKKSAASKSSTIDVQLGVLFNLQPQFQKLRSTMMSPEIAFPLRKYLVNVIDANLKIIDEQRVEYVRQFSTATEGEEPSVNFERDAKKHGQFIDALTAYFESSVNIPVSEVKMSELEKSLKAAHRNYGSMIDIQMLIDLEKFFLPE